MLLSAVVFAVLALGVVAVRRGRARSPAARRQGQRGRRRHPRRRHPRHQGHRVRPVVGDRRHRRRPLRDAAAVGRRQHLRPRRRPARSSCWPWSAASPPSAGPCSPAWPTPGCCPRSSSVAPGLANVAAVLPGLAGVTLGRNPNGAVADMRKQLEPGRTACGGVGQRPGDLRAGLRPLRGRRDRRLAVRARRRRLVRRRLPRRAVRARRPRSRPASPRSPLEWRGPHPALAAVRPRRARRRPGPAASRGGGRRCSTAEERPRPLRRQRRPRRGRLPRRRGPGHRAHRPQRRGQDHPVQRDDRAPAGRRAGRVLLDGEDISRLSPRAGPAAAWAARSSAWSCSGTSRCGRTSGSRPTSGGVEPRPAPTPRR